MGVNKFWWLTTQFNKEIIRFNSKWFWLEWAMDFNKNFFHVLSFEHTRKKTPSYKVGLGNFIPSRIVLHAVRWSAPFVFLIKSRPLHFYGLVLEFKSIAGECDCLLKHSLSSLVLGFLKVTYIVFVQLLFLFKVLNYLNFYYHWYWNVKCIYQECCGINNKQRSLRSLQFEYSECWSENLFSLLLMLEIQSFVVMDGLGKEETWSVVVISHTSQQSLHPVGSFYRQGNFCIRIEREFPSRVTDFTWGKESHHSDQVCLPWKSLF